MIIGLVIGNVWATRKEDRLSGSKLMIVRKIDPIASESFESFVAVDCVGAGAGERVLVVFGSSARTAVRNAEAPVDAAIVGIVDEMEIRRELCGADAP